MSRPRGRPPKAVAAHRLSGTFTPSRHSAREEAEPAPVGEISPVAPDWLDPTAKRIWAATLPFLMRGVVGASDTHTLAMFAQQMSVVQRATRAQSKLDDGKELPFLSKGRDGNAVVSPYIGIARRATQQAASLAAELGLSPSARARLGALAFAPEAPPLPGSDPWTGFEVFEGGKR